MENKMDNKKIYYMLINFGNSALIGLGADVSARGLARIIQETIKQKKDDSLDIAAVGLGVMCISYGITNIKRMIIDYSRK